MISIIYLLVAKFRKFREEGESNKCNFCGKTVYIAEKLLVEDRNEKRLFHKGCFKCVVCDIILDLRNYGSVEGKVYCKNHLKEAQLHTITNFSGNFFIYNNNKNISKVSSELKSNEEKQREKLQTPEHIAAKFKNLGTGDKCKICGKTVYATEKITIQELKQQSIFHKSCLKCSHCGIQLDISSFGSSGGIIYCQVHLKQFGKPGIYIF